jgi:serine protease Do
MQKTKKLFFLLLIIIISGLSGIFANRYIFPRLATTKFFTKYDFLKRSTSDVTIINKTEQIYIKDDTSISKIVRQPLSSVVSIISYSADSKKTPIIKNGTGLVVTSDGLIVTYAGAITTENASYKILTDNENIYDAELLEIDSYSNLAFLKINASNLSVASFADSNESKPGEKIIAIGNDSQSHSPSFAAGILSSFRHHYNLSEKSIASSEKLEGVFEIDLSAQNHYIGGPVVDYAGQIIGITGMVYRDNKESYFQIPSNKIKLVIDKQIRRELGTNPALGLYYLPITKTFSLINALPNESGALIYSPSGQQGLAVLANSPAANAGLRINDIITEISGEKISTEKSLPDILYGHKKGTEVELTILRNLQEMKIKVQL